MADWSDDLAGKRIIDARDSFRERVRELREERGLTQQQLADRLTELDYSFDRTQVNRIETGKRRPSLEDVLAFAYVLGVSPVELMVTHDGEARIRVVPGLRPDGPAIVSGWIAGVWPLRGQDPVKFHLAIPEEELNLAREVARGEAPWPGNMPRIQAAAKIFEAAERGARREEEADNG